MDESCFHAIPQCMVNMLLESVITSLAISPPCMQSCVVEAFGKLLLRHGYKIRQLLMTSTVG